MANTVLGAGALPGGMLPQRLPSEHTTWSPQRCVFAVCAIFDVPHAASLLLPCPQTWTRWRVSWGPTAARSRPTTRLKSAGRWAAGGGRHGSAADQQRSLTCPAARARHLLMPLRAERAELEGKRQRQRAANRAPARRGCPWEQPYVAPCTMLVNTLARWPRFRPPRLPPFHRPTPFWSGGERRSQHPATGTGLRAVLTWRS